MSQNAPPPVVAADATGVHGGPDALGVPRFDFSTNSNACGPCPQALAALQACDARHYPDPAYTALRQQLANFHGVEAWRVVLAGSASEFIYRITAWAAQQAVAAGRKRGAALLKTVRVPPHAYGDYAQAARAWGLAVVTQGSAGLLWHANPSSPLGQFAPDDADATEATVQVLDCAYAPLRLSSPAAGSDAERYAPNRTRWQLWTPNKALGLTGVRAAYAIAPLGAEAGVAALDALAPSWPVGAHGVALLQAWTQPDVHSWLTGSLATLARWKAQQIDMLQANGWDCLPSDTNFFCARPPVGVDLTDELLRLRAVGIKLRDVTSFGLSGHVRLGVMPPVAQDALKVALCDLTPPDSLDL